MLDVLQIEGRVFFVLKGQLAPITDLQASGKTAVFVMREGKNK